MEIKSSQSTDIKSNKISLIPLFVLDNSSLRIKQRNLLVTKDLPSPPFSLIPPDNLLRKKT